MGEFNQIFQEPNKFFFVRVCYHYQHILKARGSGTAFLSLSKTLGRSLLLLGLSFPMCLRGRRTPEMRSLRVLKNEDSWVGNSVIIPPSSF